MNDTTAERAFDAESSAIGEARAFVTSQAGVDGASADTLALVTSELASNAVLHARSRFVVRIERAGPSVRIAVFDHSPQLPTRMRSGPASVTGRGLGIVDSLSEGWGVDVVEDGKWVWADVDLDDGTVLQ